MGKNAVLFFKTFFNSFYIKHGYQDKMYFFFVKMQHLFPNLLRWDLST